MTAQNRVAQPGATQHRPQNRVARPSRQDGRVAKRQEAAPSVRNSSRNVGENFASRQGCQQLAGRLSEAIPPVLNQKMELHPGGVLNSRARFCESDVRLRRLSTDPASVGARLDANRETLCEQVSTGPVPVGPTTECYRRAPADSLQSLLPPTRGRRGAASKEAIGLACNHWFHRHGVGGDRPIPFRCHIIGHGYLAPIAIEIDFRGRHRRSAKSVSAAALRPLRGRNYTLDRVTGGVAALSPRLIAVTPPGSCGPA